MEEGINIIDTVEGFDNTLIEEIDLDYVKAKFEHNKKLELAEIEEAVEYLKTDLKLKLSTKFNNDYASDFFTTVLTSKHIELLALAFVEWFIEEPEAVGSEIKAFILDEVDEDFTAENTVLNILDTAINNTFVELSPDDYKFISMKERNALKEL